VEECDELCGVEEREGLADLARRHGRTDVRRPARQGEHATVGVLHDDLDEVTDTMDIADRQSMTV
jgi:hypothetical protein